jgi:hypothetical protein
MDKVYSGAAAFALATNFQQSQDTLYALASDTGGKALLDYNDLTKGIAEAARSVSSYYILGYYTTNTAPRGKFRCIKISLAADLAAKLEYRQGHFASKEFKNFMGAEKERQLEDALMLPDPITEDSEDSGDVRREVKRIARNWRREMKLPATIIAGL